MACLAQFGDQEKPLEEETSHLGMEGKGGQERGVGGGEDGQREEGKKGYVVGRKD